LRGTREQLRCRRSAPAAKRVARPAGGVSAWFPVWSASARRYVDGFVAFAHELAPKGLAVVAISANDAASYPQDSPAEMQRIATVTGFSFPYLYDASQAVAKAYQAVCTPDFFLFDRERRLRYRGQFDASRPGSQLPVTGADLRAAAQALLQGREVPAQQVPSVGCSIKWKPGEQPGWA
jgi:AhpC/TSA family